MNLLIMNCIFISGVFKSHYRKPSHMVRPPKYPLFVIIIGALLFNGFCQFDSSSGGNRKTTIAIFPCRAANGITLTEVSFVTERITLEVLRLDQFAVIDKYEIAKRMDGKNVEVFDTISDVNTYYDLGKKCGADKVLQGSLTRKGTTLQLDLCLGSVLDHRGHDSVMTSISGSTLELSERLPSLLGALFHVAVYIPTLSSATAISRNVYTPISQPRPIRFTVYSVPEGACVYLNGTEAGVTPLSKDSLKVGTYDCRIERYGYLLFSKQIVLHPNDDKKILIYLEKAFGSLTINSTPTTAAVTLSNGVTGHTPFTCDTLRGGLYNLHLTLDGYAPYHQTLSIARTKNDTVTTRLQSLKYLDSLKKVAKRKNQFIRRIGFGALTAGFLGVGVYYNIKTQEAIDRETSAFNAYMQLNSYSTPEEFTAAYAEVQDGGTEAESCHKKRNVFNVLAAVFGAGLCISIRF
jgi:hypothetical protein